MWSDKTQVGCLKTLTDREPPFASCLHSHTADIKCTVEAADTADVQVPQDRISPQVQVVWYGLEGQSGKQQVNLHTERTEHGYGTIVKQLL